MKKNQHKKYILEIAGLIILLVMGLIYFLPNASRNNPTETPLNTIPKETPDKIISEDANKTDELTPEARCETFADSKVKASCQDDLILREVLSSGFLKACDDLQVESNRNFCSDSFYKREALSKADITICEKIIDAFIKTNCLDELTLKNTIKTGVIEACEKIENTQDKDKCKNEVAFQTAYKEGDVSFCEMMTDETLKGICLSKVALQSDKIGYNEAVESQDVGLCVGLSETKKTECFNTVNFNVGVTKNDLTACKAVTDVELSNSCYDIVYKTLAKDEFNPDYCNKIKDANEKMSCLQTVNATLLKTAIKTNDPAVCEKITDGALKEKCLSAF